MSYRVIARTSVRANPDPAHPDYERWLDFEPGQRVRRPPEHAPVEEWLRSGHWERVTKETHNG